MSERKPRGYWENFENVRTELDRIMREHGCDSVPHAKQLNAWGCSSLAHAISNYHGGFPRVREVMGEGQWRGRWKDLDFVVDRIQKLMAEQGIAYMPSWDQLRELGCSSLAHAINNYHGGFPRVRELLGESQLRVKSGKYRNLAYVVDEARRVMAEKECVQLPSFKQLCGWGYSGLANGINIYHGFRRMREAMGENQLRIENGRREDVEYVLACVREVMKEKGVDSVPSWNQLYEWGYSSLAAAITKYHGGFPAFRALFEKRVNGHSSSEQLESMLDRYSRGEQGE